MIKRKELIYLFSFVLFFVFSQYYFFNYFFLQKKWNYFLFVYFFILSIIFLIGWIKKLNFFYFISVIFLSYSWYLIYKFEFNMKAFLFYGLFYFFVLLSFIYNKKKNKENLFKEYYKNNYILNWQFYILVLIFLIIFLYYPFFILNDFIENTNKIQNQPMFEISSFIYIINYIFKNTKVLIIFISYILFLIMGVLFIIKKNPNEFLILFFLYFMTFLIKIITIIIMPGDGFLWMKQIMNNRMIFDYYYFAKEIENFSEIFQKYNLIQLQEFGTAARIRTHPPFILIIFWILCRITSCGELAIGISIMLLNSFTVIIIYYIIKLLFNNKTAAFIGGVFYILSANNIMQSKIIPDSLTTTFFGLVILLLLLANKNGNYFLFLLSGFIWGIETYMQYASWIQILFFIPFFFYKRNLFISNLINAIKYFLFFILGLLLLHIIFIILKFNYIKSFNIAKDFLNHDNVGLLYTTWWWLNPIHLFQYCGGAVITSLFLLKFLNNLIQKNEIDIYSFNTLVFLVIIVTSAVVRSVLAWKFMFLVILIIPAAIATLIRKEKFILNKLEIIIFIIIIYTESIFYEFFIRDAQ